MLVRLIVRALIVFMIVVIASSLWLRPASAQGPAPKAPPTATATLIPIHIDVPQGVVFPTDPSRPGWPILPIGTLLPHSLATRIPTKAPGQTFYTPPPPGWYAPFQQNGNAPQGATTPPANSAPQGNAPAASGAAKSASSSAPSFNNAAPGWAQPSFEQSQGQAAQKSGAASSAPAISPSQSAEIDRASMQAVQAQTDRYLDWKRSQAGTTQTRSVPDPQPLIPASSTESTLRGVDTSLGSGNAPNLVSEGVHYATNIFAAQTYVDNASRDVNAPIAALADLGRRSDLEAKAGNPINLPASFFETNRLGYSPIGNVVTKDTYQRTVTIPLSNTHVPLEFTVPSALPVLGGQTLKVQTSYDVYTTDQGIRNVRVHNPIGAFQWAQDFSSSYAPNAAPRIVDGGFGSPLAVGAYNTAQALMGKQPLSASSTWESWFPGATSPGWGSGATLVIAAARAYGDSWFGGGMGANFIDSAAVCSDALTRPSSLNTIQKMDPETEFASTALDVAGYSDTIALDAAVTFGDVLGQASEGDINGAADSATATAGGDTLPQEVMPFDWQQGGQKGGGAPAPSSEQVYLKAVIPPGPPQWSMQFKPDFPVVVGQDPAKRGVDAQGQATLGACTVIWHHVVHETWTFCGKQTCDCNRDNCEERETIREWDTTEYEPDQVGSVTVNTSLSSSSVAYIQGPMQSIYPGAGVIQGNVRVYPSEWSKGASQTVGVPTVWQFNAERVPYADPGSWDVAVHLTTTGTAHCGPTPFDQTFPSAFVTWLREQRLTK